MNDSILTSIKKLLGIPEEYEHFDMDIIIHINSVLMGLTQMGIGDPKGFVITDSTQTWNDYLPGGELIKLSAVKSYIFMKVKLAFDPPQTSFVIDAYNKQINEFEWRMYVTAESNTTSAGSDVTIT